MMIIEQMARAICPEGWSDINDSGLSKKDAEAHTQIIRHWAYAKARAALTALLEPSDGMVLAGNIALSNNGVCDTDNDDSRVCIISAINAALDEKEE